MNKFFLKSILFYALIALTISFNVQASSIYFTSPTNGQVLNTVYAADNVAVNVGYHYTASYGYVYVKLFTSGQGTYSSRDEGGIPQWFYLPAGTYTWRVELWEGNELGSESKTAEQTITFYTKFKVYAKNSFNGGNINFDGVKASGSSALYYIGNSISMGAIDQTYSGDNYIWNSSGTNNSNWKRQPYNQGTYPIQGATSRNYSYSVVSNDNGATIIADMKEIVNVTFQNSFVGVGNGGVIKVNSVQYNSPKVGFPVTQLNPVTSSPVNQTITGISYTFTQWNDGNTTFNRTFYPPSDDITYTANYAGKPSNSYRNLSTNSTPGQHITLYWNEHPNTNVTQYQIWRKVKHNGVVGDPVLLSTKNRGTLTYVDNDFILTNGYTDDLLWYDVRAYYVTETSYADPQWLAVYGEEITKRSDSTYAKNESLEFRVDCFPNPFNPVTNIRAVLPSDGLLQVSIFNILGEKILDLNNAIVTKGIYEFSWNGVSASSKTVNSGIYIVLVRTDSKIISQKIMLLK